MQSGIPVEGGERREGAVDAGEFGAWLAAMRAALRGGTGMEVPCGDCTGCCISGYSVQIRPSDEKARSAIPPQLLVEAAGFGAGELTLAPRSDGVCPMLDDGRCTIYAHRPQTCLDYDCRVFAAAGIDAGGAGKVVINRRVRAWRFSYASPADERLHEAVRAAARFIERAAREGRDHEAGMRLPRSPMGTAVLAIKIAEAFLPENAEKGTDLFVFLRKENK